MFQLQMLSTKPYIGHPIISVSLRISVIMLTACNVAAAGYQPNESNVRNMCTDEVVHVCLKQNNSLTSDLNKGIVQVKVEDTWHSICYQSNTWEIEESTVVCKQLGWKGGWPDAHGYMDDSLLYSIDCKEGDKTIDPVCSENCCKGSKFTTQCYSKQLAGVECFNRFEVRLAGGRNSNAGIVQVRYDKKSWSNVCYEDKTTYTSRPWGFNDAKVICTQDLGFPGTMFVRRVSQPDFEMHLSYVKGFKCSGGEGSLADCYPSSHPDTTPCESGTTDGNSGNYVEVTCALPGYQGCFSFEQTSNNTSLKTETMTINLCRHHCRERNYSFAGLHNGDTCYCSNETPETEKLGDDKCQQPCNGSYDETCGETETASIYDVSTGVCEVQFPDRETKVYYFNEFYEEHDASSYCNNKTPYCSNTERNVEVIECQDTLKSRKEREYTTKSDGGDTQITESSTAKTERGNELTIGDGDLKFIAVSISLSTSVAVVAIIILFIFIRKKMHIKASRKEPSYTEVSRTEISISRNLSHSHCDSIRDQNSTPTQAEQTRNISSTNESTNARQSDDSIKQNGQTKTTGIPVYAVVNKRKSNPKNQSDVPCDNKWKESSHGDMPTKPEQTDPNISSTSGSVNTRQFDDPKYATYSEISRSENDKPDQPLDPPLIDKPDPPPRDLPPFYFTLEPKTQNSPLMSETVNATDDDGNQNEDPSPYAESPPNIPLNTSTEGWTVNPEYVPYPIQEGWEDNKIYNTNSTPWPSIPHGIHA